MVLELLQHLGIGRRACQGGDLLDGFRGVDTGGGYSTAVGGSNFSRDRHAAIALSFLLLQRCKPRERSKFLVGVPSEVGS